MQRVFFIVNGNATSLYSSNTDTCHFYATQLSTLNPKTLSTLNAMTLGTLKAMTLGILRQRHLGLQRQRHLTL